MRSIWSGLLLAGLAVLIVSVLAGASVAGAWQQTVTVGPGETATVDSITVTNGTDQPANIALSDGTLDVAVPVRFGVAVTGADCASVVPASNFARCKVTPGARLVLTLGEAAVPAQPVPMAERAFPQPPVGLARAGAGGPWDQAPPSGLLVLEVTAVVAALVGTALMLRSRPHK